MLFNSQVFIILLLITFIIYYLPFLNKLQVQILIISSLIFYGYSQPGLLVLLLCSACINIVSSYAVVNGKPGSRKFYATFGVCVNLAVLIFFKYSALLAHTFLNTNAGVGYYLTIIPLPIGISFYTFEGISLLIDVYSNKHSDVLTIDKSFAKHASKTLFFISFFPHLISGPILKAYEFYPQIGSKRIADIKWEAAFKQLVTGYFLKMVVADNLSGVMEGMIFPTFKDFSSLTLISMLFGYSFQIFADFAGYSLIALGLAQLFGYQLMENFNFPYISTTFSEFWTRWHISLSTFLKQYLYFPLGGNRKGKIRTYLNLFVVMVLGGLWHGAAWSYAIWGLFHGLILAIERIMADTIKVNLKGTVITIIKGGLVFLLVTLGWVLFKFSFQEVICYFQSIKLNRHFSNSYNLIYYIAVYSLPVIAYHLYYLLRDKNNKYKKYEFLAYGLMVFLIVVNSGPSGKFIYFQF